MSEGYSVAPLYIDAFDLCEWLLGRFGDDGRVLPRVLCEHALVLLEAITLALKDRHRKEQIEAADACLIRLRTELRLAESLGYLSDAQLLHVLERAEVIGRQLGGWLRSLGPV